MSSALKLPIAKERILLLLLALIVIEFIFVIYSLDFSCQQPVSAQSKSEAILRSECRISGIALSITSAISLGMIFLILLIVLAVCAQEKISRLKRL